MAFDFKQGLMGGIGAGMLGSGLGGLFGGGRDPSEEANEYIGQIPDAVRKYLAPYMGAGERAIPGLEEEYGKLIGGPGEFINKLGSGYQQSPGYKFALQEALRAAGHKSAAGGMAGSPMARQEDMDIATGLASRDYNTWLQNALGAYGTGLSGRQGLYAGGLQSSTSMADQVAQALAQQAAYQYQGAAAENAGMGANIGNLLGGVGALAGAFGWL